MWRIAREMRTIQIVLGNNPRDEATMATQMLAGRHQANNKRPMMLSQITPRTWISSAVNGAVAAAVSATISAGVLGFTAPAAQAHPHIFVDAGVTLILDAGRVTAVEVTWLYDELYTLILLEEYGLDPDFDLRLTEDEVARTLGFDLNWSFGFEGGLVMRRGEEVLSLGAPEPVSLSLLAPGQLRTVHRRAVTDATGAPDGPVQTPSETPREAFAETGAETGAETSAEIPVATSGEARTERPLEVQVFDPEFYIAFEMIGEMGTRGMDCTPELIRADLDAAYSVLEAALESIGGSVAAEDNFPAVGEVFADRVVFECAG